MSYEEELFMTRFYRPIDDHAAVAKAGTADGISVHNVLCTYPKFSGIRYTRLRKNQLKEVIEYSNDMTCISFAQQEWERRHVVDNVVGEWAVEISSHAIDSVSIRYLHKYLGENNGEGIHAWCMMQVKAALKLCREIKSHLEVDYNGMHFIFRSETARPDRLVLVTLE